MRLINPLSGNINVPAFIVRFCMDALLQVLGFGNRSRLIKFDLISQRYHRMVERFFNEAPFILISPWFEAIRLVFWLSFTFTRPLFEFELHNINYIWANLPPPLNTPNLSGGISVWWFESINMSNYMLWLIPIMALFQFTPPANFSAKNRQISKIGKIVTRGFLAMPIPYLISVFHSEAYMRHFYQPGNLLVLVLVNYLWAHF